jgi:hypothetical protein
MTREVTLQGGPGDGQKVPIEIASVITLTGDGVPEGFCARYRPIDGRKRDCTVYRFEGFSRQVLATVSRPGASA